MTTTAPIAVAVATNAPRSFSARDEEDRRDDGDGGDDHGEDAREEPLVVHVARDHERPDEEGGADDGRDRRQPRRRSPGALAQLPERAEREEDRAVEREEEADSDPGENRVGAEEVAEVPGVALVGGDRDAVEQARERDAPEERRADRADRVHPGPERPPAGALGFAPPLEREHAHDQERKDEQEREVEAREHRRVPDRERGERRPARDHEPDLVAVPQRPDRLEHRATVRLAPAEDRQQHADTEVESLEHEVRGPEEGEQAEPEDLERHAQYAGAGRGAPSSSGPTSGGSSRA